jgi:hypothetical protein
MRFGKGNREKNEGELPRLKCFQESKPKSVFPYCDILWLCKDWLFFNYSINLAISII